MDFDSFLWFGWVEGDLFADSGAQTVADDFGFTEHFVEEVAFFGVVSRFAFGGMGDLTELAFFGFVVCLETDVDIIERLGFEKAKRVTFGMGFEADLFAREFGGAVAVEQKPAKEQAEPEDAPQSLSGFGGVGDRWRGCG